MEQLYVNVTNKTVAERFEQHINDEDDMIDASYNVCELTWYRLNKSYDDLDERYKYINKKTKDKFISFVQDVYGDRCINNDNIINDIIVLEGGEEKCGDTMTFYVIYK
jgi:predicted GIY-YIG superfamily endonuclease